MRYTPESFGFLNDENKLVGFVFFKEDSAIQLKDSYLELEFDVQHRTGTNLYRDE